MERIWGGPMPRSSTGTIGVRNMSLPLEIEAALARAEAALGGGRSLKGTGFWRAVDAMRRDHTLAERYADRAAAIDRRAFERGIKLRGPAWFGVVLLAAVSLLGVAAVILAVHYGTPPRGTG